MIKDYKHLIGFQHIHMELLHLKCVKAKYYSEKNTKVKKKKKVEYVFKKH